VLAARRLELRVRRTPVERSLSLSERLGAEVWLKLENQQHTGSFKLRGAMNKLLVLGDEQRARGVVAASSGNHGLGVASAGRELDVPVQVFVPDSTGEEKITAIAAHGARVQRHGADCVDTESHARAEAQRSGRTYVSPYNDLDVVAGQGTVGAELIEQVPGLDAVYVALGGGGLVSGVGAAVCSAHPSVEIVACSPANSPAMDECVKRGEVIDVACLPTLSDSTAGGVEAGSVTLPLCTELVHRYLRVPEDALAPTLLEFYRDHHMLVEGAAAVAVAGLLQDADRVRGRRVAVVVCGGNLPLGVLRELLIE